mmetsp:Transcript_74309/g.208612  ORF Transcript_74309/g.208612 Transcript_74309/m.208612 type:complete len:127 (+) Transcript_74309:2-382(+)
MHEVLQLVQPYFGGLPQQVPFTPQLLYAPQCPFPWLVAAPHVGPVAPLPAVPAPVQVVCRQSLPQATAPVQVEEPQRWWPAQVQGAQQLRAMSMGALALPVAAPHAVQYAIAPQVSRLAAPMVGAC